MIGKKPATRTKLYPGFFTQTSKCKWCKKEFERPAGPWGWNIGDNLYCTYTCMRRADEKRRAKHLKKLSKQNAMT